METQPVQRSLVATLHANVQRSRLARHVERIAIDTISSDVTNQLARQPTAMVTMKRSLLSPPVAFSKPTKLNGLLEPVSRMLPLFKPAMVQSALTLRPMRVSLRLVPAKTESMFSKRAILLAVFSCRFTVTDASNAV